MPGRGLCAGGVCRWPDVNVWPDGARRTVCERDGLCWLAERARLREELREVRREAGAAR